LAKPYAALAALMGAMVAGCGGEDSVASRSDRALREAQARGESIDGGHRHGHAAEGEGTAAGPGGAGHAHDGGATEPPHDGHAAMGHEDPAAGAEGAHADHGISTGSPATDHGAHARAAGNSAAGTHAAGGHAAGGHGSSGGGAGQDHTAHAATGPQSTSQEGQQGHQGHQQPATGGSAASGAASAHAGHTAPPASPAPAGDHTGHVAAGGGQASQPHAGHGPTPHEPTLGAIVAGTAVGPAPAVPTGGPAATLTPGRLDAPAATSVQEAQRSAAMADAMAGGGHAGHGGHGAHGSTGYRHLDAGRGPEAYRDPQETTEGHAGHGAADGGAEEDGSSQTPVYVCPMHPEVRSDQPGTCPVCGMALERSSG
jgi:hypothetical protein